MTPEDLLLATAMAVAAGLVGCVAVMRRMALAADALSHVALPGIGLALALHVHPLAGAVVALFVGAVLVWSLGRRAGAGTDTMVGVVFSAALAAGALMSSGEELVEALVGGEGRLGAGELAFGLTAAAGVTAFIVRRRHALVVALISADVARTAGVPVARLDLQFLLLFALTIGLGLRFLGVLLMGALLIIPAATAARLTTGVRAMLATSAALAVGATVTGTLAAAALGRESGPLIVLVASAAFVASLARRRP